MAHLRGLQAECLRDLAYEDGVEAFLRQAQDYMCSRQIPEHLIAQALNAVFPFKLVLRAINHRQARLTIVHQ